MTKKSLREQFNKERGFSHQTKDYIATYINWLEDKLVESKQPSNFNGYCKQETKDKGRCKEICNKPECGW